ncbi:MAG: hypothetical protein RLZZ546_816 [Bacteroidota bacterium]|jgi:glucokinase
MMIGIDLGGTRIKGVIIDVAGKVVHQVILPTNDDGSAAPWKNTVKDVVENLLLKMNVANPRIGISAPGLPNENFNAIAFMPGRMEGLENFIWSEFLGLPTYILNDGVAALVAEAKFGAALDRQNVVMLTLGTGVGGAILINGQPYGGIFNKAGHFGHMAIDYNAEMDVTNMPGSLETCIGNYNIMERTNGIYNSTHALVEAYRAGDTFANEVWLKSVKQLAIGLASIANVLSPEVIILGGGIVEAADALFVPLVKFLEQYEWRPGGSRVEIIKAELGEIAGAIGAAVFANSK